jgi:hypothetical protein
MPDPLTAGMPERLENRMGRRVEKPQSKKNAITLKRKIEPQMDAD